MKVTPPNIPGPPENQESKPNPDLPPRRPRGKIARLPKATRDKLNVMLRDGVKYDEVLARLPEDAKDISPRNISNWHTGPSYQQWLVHQEWLEELRSDQEPAFDL